jgi:hypothetical protein
MCVLVARGDADAVLKSTGEVESLEGQSAATASDVHHEVVKRKKILRSVKKAV